MTFTAQKCGGLPGGPRALPRGWGILRGPLEGPQQREGPDADLDVSGGWESSRRLVARRREPRTGSRTRWSRGPASKPRLSSADLRRLPLPRSPAEGAAGPGEGTQRRGPEPAELSSDCNEELKSVNWAKEKGSTGETDMEMWQCSCWVGQCLLGSRGNETERDLGIWNLNYGSLQLWVMIESTIWSWEGVPDQV